MNWFDISLGLMAFYVARSVLRFIVGFTCELFHVDHKSFLKTFF